MLPGLDDHLILFDFGKSDYHACHFLLRSNHPLPDKSVTVPVDLLKDSHIMLILKNPIIGYEEYTETGITVHIKFI
jgi:hypothetical protein